MYVMMGVKKSDQVKDLITCVVVNSGKMFCTMLASLCGCAGNFLATLLSAYRPDILSVHRRVIDCHPESTKIKHTKINQRNFSCQNTYIYMYMHIYTCTYMYMHEI